MTKIVFVLPYFLPAIGGVIMHVLQLVEELINEGYEVEIHASASLQHKANFFSEGKVLFNKRLSVVYEKEIFPKFVRQLRYVKIPADVDLVHIHNFDRALTTSTTIKAQRLRKPVVMTLHGALMPFYDMREQCSINKKECILMKFKQMYDRVVSTYLLNRVDRVIALCQRERDILVKYLHVNPSKIHIIPNFVHDNLFKVNVDVDSIHIKDVRKIIKDYGENYIITISRIDRNKGLDIILHVLVRNPDVHYVLVGSDNGYLSEFLRKADKLGVKSKVHYLGTVYDIKLKIALLKYAKMFVLPSRFEAFPISILEAMSQGIPVVTVASGCLPEVIDNGINGFICKYRKDYEKYIQVLIDRDDLRKYMGLKARERVYERYRLGVVKSKLLRIYEEVTR